MKKYVSVIIWAISTFFIVSALIFGHYKDVEEQRNVVYRCYMHIDVKDGWYTGNTRPTYTGGELEKITVGSIIDGFVVSRIIRSDNEFYFDEADNPSIEESKMICFK